MNTNSSATRSVDLDDPALREADTTAVLEQLVSGKPLEPTIVERVHARAEQVTEGVRQARGLVDDETFQSLLDDEPWQVMSDLREKTSRTINTD